MKIYDFSCFSWVCAQLFASGKGRSICYGTQYYQTFAALRGQKYRYITGLNKNVSGRLSWKPPLNIPISSKYHESSLLAYQFQHAFGVNSSATPT